MQKSHGRDKVRPRRDLRSRSRMAAPPDGYEALHAGFGWSVPQRFNMAEVCARRWADNRGHRRSNGRDRTVAIAQITGAHSYRELQEQANRLSHALHAMGVRRGDRVAIVMPQRFETAVAYMAVLQMGAVGMPLSQLFGPEALAFRLQDSEAQVALCDGSTLAAVQSVSGRCPALQR